MSEKLTIKDVPWSEKELAVVDEQVKQSYAKWFLQALMPLALKVREHDLDFVALNFEENGDNVFPSGDILTCRLSSRKVLVGESLSNDDKVARVKQKFQKLGGTPQTWDFLKELLAWHDDNGHAVCARFKMDCDDQIVLGRNHIQLQFRCLGSNQELGYLELPAESSSKVIRIDRKTLSQGRSARP